MQARALSGDMKRRLNLAMALVHDPEIVVLDEPKAGLDPQSRIKVREYIQSLARLKTVILTTHNMDEADRVADRVAIIDHGEIIALGTQDELTQQVGGQDQLEFSVDGGTWPDDLTATLEAHVPGVTRAHYVAPGEIDEEGNVQTLGRLSVFAARGRQALPDVIQLLNQAGMEVHAVKVQEPDLEAVFLALTGRALRD